MTTALEMLVLFQPLKGSCFLAEARQIGFVGIVLWFGLGDLHYQNIVVGKQAEINLFAPRYRVYI